MSDIHSPRPLPAVMVPDSPSPPLSPSVIIVPDSPSPPPNSPALIVGSISKSRLARRSAIIVPDSPSPPTSSPSVIVGAISKRPSAIIVPDSPSPPPSSPSVIVGAISKSRLAPPSITVAPTLVSNEDSGAGATFGPYAAGWSHPDSPALSPSGSKLPRPSPSDSKSPLLSPSGSKSPLPSPSSIIAEWRAHHGESDDSLLYGLRAQLNLQAPTSTPVQEEESNTEWYTRRGEYIRGGTGPHDSLLYVRCTCCQAQLQVPLAKDSVTCIIKGLGVGLFQNPELVKILVSIQGSQEEEYPSIDEAKAAFRDALIAGEVQMLSLK